MRKFQFQTGNYYHIYNRGVDKRMIFLGRKDYIRFIRSMREFNRYEPIESMYRLYYLKTKEAKLPIGSLASDSDKLVEIICYNLLNNHYHLILRQRLEKGIEKFLHKLGTSYTKYFNYKYNRTGSLFQGTFKAVHIKTNENLLRLSAYVNTNSEIHQISNAERWLWASYPDYIGKRDGTLCQKKVILNQFENSEDYKKYAKYTIRKSREIKSEDKILNLE